MNYYCIVKYFHEKRQILKEQYTQKFTFAKNVFTVKNIQDMYESVFSSETEFVSYKQAAFHLLDWSGVDYLWIILMFLSAVWTLILTAPIHCKESTCEQVM